MAKRIPKKTIQEKLDISTFMCEDGVAGIYKGYMYHQENETLVRQRKATSEEIALMDELERKRGVHRKIRSLV